MKVWFIVLLAVLSAAYAQDPCVNDPFNTSCASYTLPPATSLSLTNTTCQQMPGMTGCYINQLCLDSSYKLSSDKYCNPFSVYADVCGDSSSLINQCNVPKLSTLLPSGSEVKNYSLTMCQQMNMVACSECDSSTTNCNYFKMYADLCISMPDMPECTAWKALCVEIPDWPLCSNSHRPHGDVIPAMRMFFHFGFVDYVLFKNWVPYDSMSFTAAWIAIFIFTILYEGIKLVRTRMEKRWSDSLNEEYMSVNSSTDGLLAGEAPFRPRVDFTRALMHTLEVAWGFLVMLVVMTFNVGLCLAVLAGSFIGMLLVGSAKKRDLSLYYEYDKGRKDA